MKDKAGLQSLWSKPKCIQPTYFLMRPCSAGVWYKSTRALSFDASDLNKDFLRCSALLVGNPLGPKDDLQPANPAQC